MHPYVQTTPEWEDCTVAVTAAVTAAVAWTPQKSGTPADNPSSWLPPVTHQNYIQCVGKCCRTELFLNHSELKYTVLWDYWQKQ